MSNEYQILKTETGNGAAHLRIIKNVTDEYRLNTGESCLHNFPGDAFFKMNDSFPDDKRLLDSLRNLNSLLVVSERFMKALESIPGALIQNEVLPVSIVNHRGQKEKAPYFIIHQLDYPPCLDEDKTKGTRSTLDPTQFQFLKKMVLDVQRIPSNLMLFRAAQYPLLPLIHRDLAEFLSTLNLEGIRICSIDGYKF